MRTVLLALIPTVSACGLFSTGAEHPRVPARGHLIQTADGLFDDQGRYLADLGGDGATDTLVVDASLPSFALLGDGIRVAHRDGEGISVVELGQGQVQRTAGSVSFVQDGGSWRVVGEDGQTLLDGYRPWDRSAIERSAAPVHLPEYWWNTGADTLPVPVCRALGGRADERDCGWVHADGKVDGPGMAFITGYTTGWGRHAVQGVITFHRADGSEGRTLPATWEPLGPPADDGHAMVLDGDRHPSMPSRLGVLDAHGQVTPVEEPPGSWYVVDKAGIQRCAGPITQCPYRFHEGLAPVWLQAPNGQFGAAYVDTDGRIAIGPWICDGNVLSGPFHEGRALACKDEGYVLIDTDGNTLAGPFPTWTATTDSAPETYAGGLFFSEGLAAVPADGGGWQVIDPEGQVVLPGPYEAIRPFRLGMSTVVEGGIVKVVNRTGARVMQKSAPVPAIEAPAPPPAE